MKKIASIAIVVVLLSLMLLVGMPVKVQAPTQVPRYDSHGVYTPNAAGLVASAMRRGLLPADATEEQVSNYLTKYLRQKVTSPYEYSRPEMAERIAARDNGIDIGIDAEIDPTGVAKMLVLVIEFTGTDDGHTGPEHNLIPEPVAPDNTRFWISDFDAAHYNSMLFDTDPEKLSMNNYFLEQSYGMFGVDGTAFGWVHIDNSEWWYGADDPAGGSDNLNGPVWQIVGDAIAAANSQLTIPWKDFDTNGDGIIDHFALIHAGADQAAGGGAQGDDAIWSHSWTTVWASNPNGYECGTNSTGDPIYVHDYTIMPEDGNLGVFCHEFGHDIGLPDSYDTIYSGTSNPAFWDLMATGSWLGDEKTLDTRPSHISIWGKYALGWVGPGLGNMLIYTLPDLTEGFDVTMKQVEETGSGIKAVRVTLPPRSFYMNTPYSGSYEWWGGKADLAWNMLIREVDLTSTSSATLDFMTWYAIEADWDFGFVQVSTDGGSTWTSLTDEEGRVTSEHDPEAAPWIVASLPGFTGLSNGWIHETFDLSAYAGESILLSFTYMTDWGTTLDGWFLDEINIVADGTNIFHDDVETLDPGWLTSGWTRNNGIRSIAHYYIMEWRNFIGFDESLRYCYSYPSNYYYNLGYAERYSYNPGLLIWYRDFMYTDNWVGLHSGHGYLLVADSHPQPLKTPIGGYTWGTSVQVQDATFSTQRTISNTLTYATPKLGYGTKTYPSLHGVPIFDDSHSYYNPAVEPKFVTDGRIIWRYPFAPDAGTIVPTYGLRVTVKSQDAANTWASLRLVMQK
jgi:immune inhibitor A